MSSTERKINYLSIDFLASRGIQVTKPLRDWLTRANFLAKNRGSPAERQRYECWALQMIEDALKGASRSAELDWSKISPVMPLNAPECRPSFIYGNESISSTAVSHEGSVECREMLYCETIRRAPVELREYVIKAFELYDKDVASHKRSYHQVTFLEMLNISQNLYNYDLRQRYSAVTRAIICNKMDTALNSPRSGDRAMITPAQTVSMVSLHAKDAVSESSSASASVPVLSASTASRHTNLREKSAHGLLAGPITSHKRTRESSAFTEGDRIYFNEMANGQCSKFISEKVFTGTSTELERVYSRYEPAVEDIRPLHVLKKAFKFVCGQAREKEELEGPSAALTYLSEQLKGMRQDIRVQSIADNFAVSVYELHARLCLKIGDIGEFNQCQATLKRLYVSNSTCKSECKIEEFFCYRLVYLCLSEQYDSLSTELINYTNAHTKVSSKKAGKNEFLSRHNVHCTLKLCEACDKGDCAAINRYLPYFPKEMTSLIRIYLPRLRVRWLREIICSFRGLVPIFFIMSKLGFTPSDSFWLDGSKEDAEKALLEFFSRLKIVTPVNFSFEREIERCSSRDRCESSGNISTRIASLDAAEVQQLVLQYIDYLSTRKDANTQHTRLASFNE